METNQQTDALIDHSVWVILKVIKFGMGQTPSYFSYVVGSESIGSDFELPKMLTLCRNVFIKVYSLGQRVWDIICST